MSYLLLLILIVIISLYVYSNYKYPTNVSIIQTNLDELKFNILLEKQPVIIENNKTDLEQLQKSLFSFMNYSLYDLEESDEWHKNRFKYLVLQSTSDNSEIYIFPPYIKFDESSPEFEGDITNVQLSFGQCIILPFHWKYLIKKNNYMCLGVHNMATYLLP